VEDLAVLMVGAARAEVAQAEAVLTEGAAVARVQAEEEPPAQVEGAAAAIAKIAINDCYGFREPRESHSLRT
jgi:hypothetical protein